MNLNRTLVRLPCDNVDKGLRIDDRGSVNVARAKAQHAAYCEELKRLGYTIDLVLPADNAYPDSLFVEDPAVIVEQSLVMTRLRRRERQGEEAVMEKVLRPYYRDVFRIEDPGFVEGGDVLVTDNRLYIGLSKRTNFEGAEQLARIARDRHNYHSVFIEIPDDHLHLKGEMSYHRSDGGLIVVSERLAKDFRGSPERLLVVPCDDPMQRFGANCISKEKRVLIHGGCTEARRVLEQEGFDVREVLLDEYDKIDGAMTCMSKFF